ncbi:MAG: ChbG/HpnK family deacetylase [Alphaproteobacteria bacterium]|nr:ChbG/HpnK family deacetylase [Alphaproteobacteria bacterium]
MALNQGIKRGAKTRIITSTSLMATGCAFDDAVLNVWPEMPPIKVGVHLNIIEGQSLTNPQHLCDKNGRFNKHFLAIRKLSQEPQVLKEIENEFRAQIEKVMQHIKPSLSCSHTCNNAHF